MRREFKLEVEASKVSALLDLPRGKPKAALTLAHGAGAGMSHKFLEELATALAAQGIAVLRFQFPYMEEGKRMPGSPKNAIGAVAAAVTRLREECPGVPLFASGKSYGGRMTTVGAADGDLPDVQGIISFGYPLHNPDQPGIDRAKHLDRVKSTHLILQGDRDKLAQLDLLEGVCKKLPRVRLHIIKHADHGFDVLKSSGRTHADVMAELVRESVAFMIA